MSAYTTEIVEGVMNRILYTIGRVVWNNSQKKWGEDWGGAFEPIECGPVSVGISNHEGDIHMNVVAFGIAVGTWLDSKRPYYHSHLPLDWSDYEFIGWAQRVFIALQAIDHIATRSRLGLPEQVQ